jgi:hypothetical protein
MVCLGVTDGADCRKRRGTRHPPRQSDREPAILRPMPSLSRHLVTALVWIAIALLPLRGFAAVWMPAARGDMPAAVHADAPGAMPCHGAAHDDGAAPTEASHSCALCDLCHSGVAQAAPAAVALPVLDHVTPPPAALTAIEPRAPDGVFRPPRALLA